MSPREKKEDVRSKRFAFVPFCLICQAFQAQGIVRNFPATVRPVLELLVAQDINLIQMPCPESLFGGLEQSLIRAPKGYQQYNTNEFREHCSRLASGILGTFDVLSTKGYEVVAFLGIEHSPSCAVKYQYQGHIVHQKGVFIENIEKGLAIRNIEIPFVGVNRGGVKPALEQLKHLFSTQATLF